MVPSIQKDLAGFQAGKCGTVLPEIKNKEKA
jgi:hypothetical protein